MMLSESSGTTSQATSRMISADMRFITLSTMGLSDIL